jgi:predicted MFS family arabinose efflux permease
MMLMFLPSDDHRSLCPVAWQSIASHFRKSDRFAGMIAAFLTSGGIVGFLTYVGAWLAVDHGVSIPKIGLLFMAAGFAAVVASPAAGWLSDRIGKLSVIIGANIALAVLFLIVARMNWGISLVGGIAVLSVAASARQAPLHALTTELVQTDVRGEYIALRNASSQLGIAAVAAVSSYAFDSGGFIKVALIAAIVTALVPVSCIWIREPR